MEHLLRDQLAELFNTEQDARRIVDDAQLDAKFIDFDGSAVNFWHSILSEAYKQEKVKAVTEQAIQAYPNRESDLWQAFRAFEVAAAPVDLIGTQQTRPEGAPVSSPDPTMQWGQHVPLVGRKQEWQALQQAWQQMTSRGPHLVTVWGEAGVGKTRLVEELLHWASVQPGTVAYTRSYATEGDLGYAPVTTWLRSEGLRKDLADLDDIWLTELARLLPELLTENPNLSPPVPMSEGSQRQRFQEALARGVLAPRAPRLLVLDDLQWCDSETLAWLSYLLRFERQTPLLVVGTVRSEAIDDKHPLHALRQHLQREAQWTELKLEALSAEETAELAGYLTDEDVTGWTMQLYQETEGNPLFVVEMMRAGMMGQANGPEGEAVALPPTVQVVITTRLDQLSAPARQLVDIAATIGREFTLEVLAAASYASEDMLVVPLDELWQRRIVREHRQGYDFSHDKIREVAYVALSPMRRRMFHRQVAEALKVIYEHDMNAASGLLATHFRQAGLPDKAIPYYRQAAVAASRVGAYEGARDYCNKGLELLENLPVTQGSMRQALELLIDLGSILMATRGYASDEVLSTYERARNLCQQIDGTPNLFQVLYGASMCHLVRAELQITRDLAEQCLGIAQQDLGQRLEALIILGVTLLYLGEFELALEHLEEGTKLYDPAQHRDHIFDYAQDPGVACLSYAGMALWFLGHSAQALEKTQKAYELACNVSHPFSQAVALFYMSFIFQLRQEWQPAYDRAKAMVNLSEQYGFRFWSVSGNLYRNRMTVKLRPASAKKLLKTLERQTREYEAMGAKLGLPFWSGMMAEIYRDVAQIEKALGEVKQGLQRAESSGDNLYTAELWRLKGELTLELSLENADQAEKYFRTSLKLAKKQKPSNYAQQ